MSSSPAPRARESPDGSGVASPATDRGGVPRRRRAPSGERRSRGDHDPLARAGGGRQPRSRPLLLRLDGEPARARARALHRADDRPPARDVLGARRAVHREVAHRDGLPRRRPRLPEGLVGAAGDGVEPARAASAHRARQRGVARGAARGVLRAARALRDRHAARRARVARGHVQRGHHPRAAVGNRTGQAELLAWIDAFLEGRDER